MLKKPSDLTRDVWLTIQNHFEQLVSLFLTETPSKKVSSYQGLRLRGWDFSKDEFGPAVDLYFDKGYENPSEVSLTQSNSAKLAHPLDLVECARLHKFFLKKEAFSFFPDQIEIRLGTVGTPPILFGPLDFVASIGHDVSLTLWTGETFKGTLLAATQDGNNSHLKMRIDEVEQIFEGEIVRFGYLMDGF